MCIVCGPGGNRFLQSIVARYGTVSAPARGGSRFAAEAIAPAVTLPLDPTDRTDLEGAADVILIGAVLTMRRPGDAADAVAVRAGRIQRVGSKEFVLDLRGRLTRVIDLDGRTLAPGFVAPHWHPPLSLLCDWLEADRTSAAALASAISERSEEWLVLRFHRSSEDMAKAKLVAACPRPAVVVDESGSILAASAAARAWAPEIVAPPRTHVSALLSTFAERLVVSRQPVRRRLREALEESARAGVTTIRFCGLGALTGDGDPDLLREAVGESAPLRVRGALEARFALQSDADRFVPGSGDDMFRIDTATRWLDEADEDERSLAATVVALRKRGWRVTLHADGPRAVDRALEAFSTAARSGLTLDVSDGVECRTPLSGGTWARVRDLGISAGLTLDEGVVLRDAPPDFTAQAAVPWSPSLDVIAGPSAPLRALASIARSVNASAGACDWLPSVTSDAAARCGVGAILGSIEVGKYADFAFLAANPRGLDVRDLWRVECVGTWIAGRELRM